MCGSYRWTFAMKIAHNSTLNDRCNTYVYVQKKACVENEVKPQTNSQINKLKRKQYVLQNFIAYDLRYWLPYGKQIVFCEVYVDISQ